MKRHTEDCLEPFLAGGISSACASLEEGGTLRVSGRKIGEIEPVVESFQLGEFKYEQIVPEVARFTKEVVRRFVDNGSTSIRNLARVLCGSSFGTLPGFYSYSDRHFPILEEGEEAAESLSERFTKGWSRSQPFFLTACNGPSLFQCSDGTLGLAPKASRPVVVVAWLGCRAPIVLRPSRNGCYLLVGKAYCDGVMWVEAFLGPLPEDFDAMQNYDGRISRCCPGYIKCTSDEFYPAGKDPRLSDYPLPAAWRRKTHELEDFVNLFMNDETGEETGMDPRMSPAELRRGGLELEEFELK